MNVIFGVLWYIIIYNNIDGRNIKATIESLEINQQLIVFTDRLATSVATRTFRLPLLNFERAPNR